MSSWPINLGDELRKRAEKLIDESPVDPPPGMADALVLLEELRVYQAELQVQNDDLCRSQEELAQSQALYRSLFHLLPISCLHLDPTGRITQANAEASRFLWSRAGLEDKFLLSYVASEYREVFRAHFSEASQCLDQVKCKLALAPAGEDRAMVEMRTIGLHSEGKEVPEGFLTTLVDLSGHLAFEKELQEKSAKIHEANVALKVLLENRDQERIDLEESVRASVQQLVVPMLDQLHLADSRKERDALLDVVKCHLAKITSGFTQRLSSVEFGLSQRELEVASLVKEGKTSDQIGDLLCISHSAVMFHRNNIRKKLGLISKKVRLAVYLRQMSTSP